jgi:DNA polymerase III delta prime subunit
MPGSIIIFGGNKNSRKSRAVELISKTFKKIDSWEMLYKNPDIKVVNIPDDKKSVGIGEVREIIKYLIEKPFAGKSKFVVINDANTLTREAQNAMLKTLEEPPSTANLILLTKTLNDLLGTVVSRCRKMEVKREKHENAEETCDSYRRILQLDPGKRLDWAGEISKEEREDIVQLLEKWVAEARDIMVNSPGAIKLRNLKQIIVVKGNIENTNVNAKLSLEALVLNL